MKSTTEPVWKAKFSFSTDDVEKIFLLEFKIRKKKNIQLRLDEDLFVTVFNYNKFVSDTFLGKFNLSLYSVVYSKPNVNLKINEASQTMYLIF